MIVRLFKPEDTSDIITLLSDYAHNAGACKRKPAPEGTVSTFTTSHTPDSLQHKLTVNYTRVIEDEGIIIGFGSISDMGRIDELYIHKDYIRQGLATVIVSELENYARHANIDTITIISPMASHTLFKRLDYELTDGLPHGPEECVTLVKKLIVNHPPQNIGS